MEEDTVKTFRGKGKTEEEIGTRLFCSCPGGPRMATSGVIRWKTGLARDRTGQVSRSDGEGHASPRKLTEGLPLKGPQLQGAVARCG